MQRSEQPFRCTCSRQTVLGMVGVDENGLLYFHKIYFKRGEPYDQTYTNNSLKVWCRTCHRWWNIKIENKKADGKEVLTPKPLTLKRSDSVCLPPVPDSL